MAHQIDMSTGKPAIAYTGEVPWHGLGTKLERAATIPEWQEAAGLNWRARKVAVRFTPKLKDFQLAGARAEDRDRVQKYPRRHVLYRTDTLDPLSIVSSIYKPVQPKDVLEFFRAVAEALGFRLEIAGALYGGKRIWGLASGAGAFKVGKADKILRKLLVATSYDKSLMTLIQQTSVRVVCANTLAISIGANDEPRIRIPHNTTFSLEEIVKLMKPSKHWDEFQGLADHLASRAVNERTARAYFRHVLYPGLEKKPDSATEKALGINLDRLSYLRYNAPGQDLPSARGTAWGLLNAITFYVDHEVRGRSPDRRLDRAWFGDGAQRKVLALKLAKDL